MERDPITGLPDGGAVLAHLRELIGARRTAAVFAVSLLDLDELGRLAPDAVTVAMRAAGDRLSGLVRTSDQLGVIEPGLFVLVAGGVPADAADVVRQRIEGAVAFPVEIGGQPISLAVEVGVAFTGGGTDADELLRRAVADRARGG